MIEQSLLFTKNILDQFLQNKLGLSDSTVLINNIAEADGSIPPKNQNKVVISLINIDQETNQPFYDRSQRLSNGSFVNVQRADRFNLDILITSQFDDYRETLKFLNASILFFQSNQIITASSFSNMPTGFNKLEFHIAKLDYLAMQNLWTAMGAKYMPSVVYKMRLIEVQANEITGFTSNVNQHQLK
ncbi:MAG: DUF4255 domain-containing protein [Flavobacteriales bacterium]|nr:DUF4255 domain-containing protein [Flavobacteriales bacterium]